MALDDLLISTGVDQLIKLVRERGRIEVSAAARELKLPQKTVEDWSRVLEEEGLVKLEYKLTKVYLSWQAPTSQYIAQKSGELSVRTGQAKKEVESLLSRVEEGGQELQSMKDELSRLKKASSFDPSEAARLKAELAALQKKYDATLTSSAEKLAKLKKQLLALSPKVNKAEAGEGAKAASELEAELGVLRKFEQTIESQLGDTEAFFDAFSARLEDFRRGIEEGRSDEKLSELSGELAEARGLREELVGAMEAIVEEHKALSEKLSSLEEKVRAVSGGEESLEAAKKKLAELRRMGQDAAKQRKVATEQLSDSLSLVRKQSARVKELLEGQAGSAQKLQQLKDDYVDIAEEISRAGEEIAAKQKEAASRIGGQVSALQGLSEGGAPKMDQEEASKISGMLTVLEERKAALEDSVRALAKEAELLKIEAVPVAAGPGASAPQAAAPAGEAPAAFVEKVRLSAEEEEDFERKREELRALIRRMWEESKGGSGS